MALPNPTLTWVKTAEQAVAGTTKQQLIDAIDACITALPAGDQKWTSAVPTGSDATTPGLVINPPAGSPILTKFSAIIGLSDGTDPVAARNLDGNTPVANGAFAGFGGQYVAGNDFSTHAEPFGTGVRVALYAARMVRAIAAGPVPSAVFAIASEETIFFGFKYSATEWYGVYFGAIIEPINLGSAEGGAAATGGERIYGMIASGNSATVSMSASATVGLISSGNNSFGYNVTSAGQSKFGVFDPLADTTVKRVQVVRTSTIPTAVGMGLAPDGEPFLRAIYVALDASPFTPYGRLRQAYFYDRSRMGLTLQSAGPVDEGYVIAGNQSADNESWVFANA